jgi:hypothetical protein
MSLFVKSLFVDVDPEHDWLSPLLSSGNGEAKKAAKAKASDEIGPTEDSMKPTQAPGP